MVKVTYTCSIEWSDEEANELDDEELIDSAIEIMSQSEFDSIGEFKIVRDNS